VFLVKLHGAVMADGLATDGRDAKYCHRLAVPSRRRMPAAARRVMLHDEYPIARMWTDALAAHLTPGPRIMRNSSLAPYERVLAAVDRSAVDEPRSGPVVFETSG